ncbi:MAG: ribonuclease HI, partial [Treponema sp.]|nr:ribonuclease HI [Treponema sp.]
KGITEWISTWKRNSWKTSDKKPVKNQDLWMELDSLNKELSLSWIWVRGHSGNEYNERCDRMTQEAITSIL